jgi:DNA polymerase-1
LAAHLLDENRPKGLKPLAQQLLGAEPWGIDTRDLLTTPIADVLWYNALDTWHTLRLSDVLKRDLIKRPRIARIFKFIMMPASEALTFSEAKGIWVDRDQMEKNCAIAAANQAEIETLLSVWIPPSEEWPEKIKAVNYNPSNFLRWWLFDHLNFPVIARGKQKDDGSPGDPSVSESVMFTLAELPHADVPQLLIKRSWWNKCQTSFFNPYAEQLDDDGYIHTNFKLNGTTTGRLSSGKADEDKLTARKQERGMNAQQVPRDIFVRGIFGAPPGRKFVQADYSQVELRTVAFVAQERNMLHHYNTGQDLHMAMAMRMTGKPREKITKEERKAAKPVNFGFLYGMNWAKFIETAWTQYQVHFTEEQAKAAKRAFFEMWSDLPAWHNKQRRLVRKYARVESPIGRIRHLPDIRSADEGVRAEAERQAINSPIQSFASDMALLALTILHDLFITHDIDGHIVGTVHDAINFDIADHDLARALPLIKDTMENLPLRRLFGVNLTVPIVADVSVGTRWGGARELTPAEVYDYRGEMAA